jgi:hypothetical protein
MGKYRNIGTIDGGVFGGGLGIGSMGRSIPLRMNDSAIANGGAFLASELEKLDPKISEPLSSLTYPRDIRVKVGGGWVDTIAKMNIDYAAPGGSENGPVTAPGANTNNRSGEVQQGRIQHAFVFDCHADSVCRYAAAAGDGPKPRTDSHGSNPPELRQAHGDQRVPRA